MKVFISHQAADSVAAMRVQQRLHFHGIPSYLDVIDPYIVGRGEDLATHIRRQMGSCTQLLAIISDATKASQWVPWEIGVATEKDFPLATYSGVSTLPPEFLRKWPYLRTEQDIDRYAAASKAASHAFSRKRATLTETVARMSSTQDFYTELRRSLGQ